MASEHNNPVCACGHKRSSHSKEGCKALDPKTYQYCTCTTTYMELKGK